MKEAFIDGDSLEFRIGKKKLTLREHWDSTRDHLAIKIS